MISALTNHMMTKATVLLAILGAIGLGCQTKTQEQQAGKLAGPDQPYLQKLADRDQDMIAIAIAAEKKSSQEHLKTMARNCVTKQEAEVRQLQAWIANWYGAKYAPQPTAEGQQMLAHLNSLSGVDFDREYLTDMIHEYQANVEISRPIASTANVPEVRAFAEQLIKEQTHQVSHLQEHLAEIK